MSYLHHLEKLKKVSLTTCAVLLLGNSSFAASDSSVITNQSVTNATQVEDQATPPVKHHKKQLTDDQQNSDPASYPNSIPAASNNHDLNLSPVVVRATNENRLLQNPFSIAFYKPTYILPYYYTRSPDNSVYAGETPEGESLKKSEVKYQLSFKVPIWQRIFSTPTSMYFAYSQLSYWQLYDRDPFFRETDYEPEFFLSSEVNWHLLGSWHINFLNLGAIHQSNGFGGAQERSWNRVYMGATASSENWVITVRPWYVFHDSTYERQNPNMANYLGHEQIIVACKFYSQVLALEARNAIEHHGRHAALTATWSFPITKHINGYLQVFSGYGQSLIEYNHRTNSAGVGIALSNWV
jgi:phospholipase A1